MHKKTLLIKGLILTILACFVLLNGCTAPTSNAPEGTNKGSDTRPSGPIKKAASNPLACQASVLRPAKFTTRSERLRVFEPAPEFTNIPAVTDWGIKRIQTEPARFAHETTPAQYKEVTETVVVLRERIELEAFPAVYKTIERPVTVEPSYTRWKKGCVAKQPAECFEQIPARIRTLQQKIVDIPPKIIQKRHPGKTIKVKRKVLVTPGRGTGPVIQARYRDIKVGKVTDVWRITTHQPSPKYEIFPVKIKTREEQIKKVATLCEGNDAANHQYITQIQQRLRQRGYPATTTGKLDALTHKALTKFQQDNDLFIGAVTAETLNRLGLVLQ